jgi:hypothetical protein
MKINLEGSIDFGKSYTTSQVLQVLVVSSGQKYYAIKGIST